MVWRGPMVTSAEPAAGHTGAIWITWLWTCRPEPASADLAQRFPVNGAVIVTTPQDIALLDGG